MVDDLPATVKFPKLKQRISHAPMIAIFFGIPTGVAFIVFEHSVLGGVILCLPIAYLIGDSMALGLSNKRRLQEWARRHTRYIHPNEVKELVGLQPRRYILYTLVYRQIDRTSLEPVSVLQDIETQELIAVYPSSWDVIKTCREQGAKVVKYQG